MLIKPDDLTLKAVDLLAHINSLLVVIVYSRRFKGGGRKRHRAGFETGIGSAAD